MGRIWELVLILAIILIFFGAGKLPKVMKDVGKSIRGLKDGMKDDGEEGLDDKKNKDGKDIKNIKDIEEDKDKK